MIQINIWQQVKKFGQLVKNNSDVISAVTMLLTVAFAFLTWREMKETSKLQIDMIRSQSLPRIEIVDIPLFNRNSQTSAWIELQNFGDSSALNLCLKVGKTKSLIEQCFGEIQRDEQFSVEIGHQEIEKWGASGVKSVAFLFDKKKENPACDHVNFAPLELSYSDVLGKSHVKTKFLMFCLGSHKDGDHTIISNEEP
jgi:hypothetical protein